MTGSLLCKEFAIYNTKNVLATSRKVGTSARPLDYHSKVFLERRLTGQAQGLGICI